MREIKFRGKRVDTKEWVYGFVYHFNSSVGDTKASFIIGGAEFDSKSRWFSLCNIKEVITETIGQFTGLTDKNGKEIYEGDILNYTFPWTDYKHFWRKDEYMVETTKTKFMEVKWKENGCGWNLIYGECQFYEVIGNIHENGDLLK